MEQTSALKQSSDRVEELAEKCLKATIGKVSPELRQ
jgi:hypothetical protein